MVLKLTSPTGWSKPGPSYPCTGSRAKRSPCSNYWRHAFDYTTDDMPEGTVPIRATATDIVGNKADIANWQVKVDRSGPTITGEPTGALYENRNRDDDHRREGLYEAQAAIHAEAKDDPSAADSATNRSGTKSLQLWIDKNRDGTYSSDELVKDQPNAGCTTTQCPNGLSLDYSLATDPLTDGDYKVKLVATDLAGNASAAKEWTVTIDRIGDFYEARQVTAPSGPDIEVSHEWLKFGTLQGRSETGDSLNTRRTEPCQDTPAESCDVARKRTFFSDEGVSNPDAPDAYEMTTGPPGSSDVPNVLRLLIKREINEGRGRRRVVGDGALADTPARSWERV